MIKFINNIGWNKNWKDAYFFYEKGIIVSIFTIVLTVLFFNLC